MRRPAVLAALLLVLAAALGAAAVVLPGRGGAERTQAQTQAEEAVRQIVDAQLALLALHGETGAFRPFTAAEPDQDRGLLGLPWRGFPVGAYAFEAEALPTDNLRVRAAPRPDAVMSGDAIARFYVAEVSLEGEIVDSGWLPAGQ